MNDPTAEQLIRSLGLVPLPWEGGYFKRTHTSSERVEVNRHGKRVERPAGTSILYLITRENFSAIHRVASDETFHFYRGAEVELVTFGQDAPLVRSLLSRDQSQFTVSANLWQALRIAGVGDWSLLGTNVFPGFDYDDFELGDRQRLISEFPSYEKILIELTRE